MPRTLLAVVAALLLSAPALAQAPLRVATWNLEWLTDRDSPAGPPRTADDYDRLAHYARLLDADVVALQEVDGPEVAARVFPPDEYAFYFEPGDNLQRVGFAVRRHLAVTDDPDYTALAVSPRLRAGAVITVEVDGQPLRLMAVHLKSGCFQVAPETDSDACRSFRPQIPLVEAWMDEQARAGVAFAVLGDFNRRLMLPGDVVWAEWDDAEPAGAGLTAVAEGRTSTCNGGRYPDFIDHIVLSEAAASWLRPDSFHLVDYEAGETARLSDHCAVRVELSPSPLSPEDVRRQSILARIGELERLLHELREIVEEGR